MKKPFLVGLYNIVQVFGDQVGQLRKNLYGVPLIIGGWRKQNGQVKGVVATASYEARSYGIKTGMSVLEAWQLCPYVLYAASRLPRVYSYLGTSSFHPG